MTQDWFTVAQFADEVGVSTLTIYRAIKKGEIRVLRIGSQIRIPRSELQIKA